MLIYIDVFGVAVVVASIETLRLRRCAALASPHVVAARQSIEALRLRRYTLIELASPTLLYVASINRDAALVRVTVVPATVGGLYLVIPW